MRRWLYNFIYLDFSFRKDKQNYHHIRPTPLLICIYHCYLPHISAHYGLQYTYLLPAIAVYINHSLPQATTIWRLFTVTRGFAAFSRRRLYSYIMPPLSPFRPTFVNVLSKSALQMHKNNPNLIIIANKFFISL